MSIKKILALSFTESEIIGVTCSPFYQLYDDSTGWTWAVDVDIGEPEVLRSVPIATNNREIFYADQGKPVALRRESGRWVVIGLAKTVKNTRHIMYVCFEDDIPEIVDEETTGYQVRMLTYGELGTLVPDTGYGFFPYGTQGRFNLNGNLIEIIVPGPRQEVQQENP